MTKNIKVNLGAKVREIALTQGQSDRVIAAITHAYGYQAKTKDEEGNEIDNPQSQDEFVTAVIQKFLEEHVVAYEREQARKTVEESIEPFSISA